MNKAEEPSRPVPIQVRSSNPQLSQLHYTRSPHELQAVETAILNFALQLEREHRRHIRAVLTLAARAGAWMNATVEYRMECVVRGPISDVGLEEVIRELGTQTLPAALMPFIRETILTVTQKGAARGVLIPLYPIAELFPLEQIEVPTSEVEPPPELLTLEEAPNVEDN